MKGGEGLCGVVKDADIRVEWKGLSSGGDGFGFQFVLRLQLITQKDSQMYLYS